MLVDSVGQHGGAQIDHNGHVLFDSRYVTEVFVQIVSGCTATSRCCVFDFICERILPNSSPQPLLLPASPLIADIIYRVFKVSLLQITPISLVLVK